MQNMEEQTLASNKRTIPLWLRFVDNTFTTLHKDEINVFHEHLIKTTTFSLPRRLRIMVIFLFLADWSPRENDRVQTTVHEKRAHTNRLLNKSCYNPISHKATAIRTLTRRALLLCDSHDSLADEHKYLDNVFNKNNYTRDPTVSVENQTQQTLT